MRFDEIIGQKITIALLTSENHYLVTLRGAEEGGIWVESPELDALIGHTPSAVKKPKTTKPPTRPTFFIPYAQLGFAVYDSTDLGE